MSLVYNRSLAVLIVTFVHCPPTTPNTTRPITVEMISLAMYHVIIAGALPLTGPGFDMAMSDLQARRRGNSSRPFDLRFTYLFDVSFRTCADFAAGADLLLAANYYTRTKMADVTVFISPGCGSDAVSIAKFGAAWNELVIST
ncbi:hypothetical protein BV898_09993 [Hypsibius exemplaris]|uniref:Receptor ligand binding region domain-containing protein n=1 Tax=Hypsibius exemplaris TaxID=2072580 RepID=A0A1W0WL59_HYPEX|nr:hypothetical protein BV898_09993 [Hypsibius exemplaris]